MVPLGRGLEVTHLHREFASSDGKPPRRAVVDFNLTVQPGELISVLGPNGAGKTTTVRMLTGLLLPSSGTILVDGHDVVSDRRKASLACGFSLGGDNGLYPRLTARQNLTFFGLMYGLRGAALDRRTEEMLAQVDLDQRATDLVRTFSRGMKQRLHLARALLHDPQVLILDEPSAGLDLQAAAAMRALMARLSSEGRSILLTTHDMREAEELSDRIVLMEEGRIRTESTAAELRLAAAQRLGHTVQAVFAGGEVPEGVSACPGLLREHRDGAAVTLWSTDGVAAIQWIMGTFPGQTVSVAVTPPTLEEVLLEMVTS
jgi:ABC-2 type transport system ATP-binding protein